MTIELTHPSRISSTARVFVPSPARADASADADMGRRIAERSAWLVAARVARLIVNLCPMSVAAEFPTIKTWQQSNGAWAVVVWTHEDSPAALAAVEEAVKASETGVL